MEMEGDMTRRKLDPSLEAWVAARKRHKLSHAHVQMARALGMNPRKLGGLDNHRDEPWKAPLPEFIQELYAERFGRDQPEVVLSIEEIARRRAQKRAARREAKRREAAPSVTIPDRKISETILDFGEPLLAQLGDAPSIEAAENALDIVVMLWNAYVMAMPIWGKPEELARVQALLRDSRVLPYMTDTLEALCARRREKFSDDPRAVGACAIVPDGHGGYNFKCAARVPQSLVPRL